MTNSVPNVVYVIEDDHMLRLWLNVELSTRGFVPRSFESAAEFLREYKTLAAGCVVSDLRMPEMDGLQLVRRLRAAQRKFPVLLMSAYADLDLAVEAMKCGAVDFIEKPFRGAVLAERLVTAQKRFLAPLFVKPPGELGEAARDRLGNLTLREREVFEGLVNGGQNKQIAQRLGISPRTVEIYRAHVMEKTGCRSVAELVRLALAASGGAEPVDRTVL
jgi:two-component system response regulator FixJ